MSIRVEIVGEPGRNIPWLRVFDGITELRDIVVVKLLPGGGIMVTQHVLEEEGLGLGFEFVAQDLIDRRSGVAV